MKNTILAIGVAVLCAIGFNANAAVTSTNASANTCYTMPTILGGGALVTQIILTSDSTHDANIQVFDASSTNLSLINPAYIQVTSYATNYYQVWTNYYNVVNYSITNVALIDVTNTVAASTNLQGAVFNLTVGTNSTATFILSKQFYRGITFTNIGTAKTPTVSFTYSQ
jgi:hypothetical protein